MSGAAVHFGAGNIGRGFVGLLLHRAGYQLVFTDVIDELIHTLNSTPNYLVKKVGATRTSRTRKGGQHPYGARAGRPWSERAFSAPMATVPS
jgi:mannitol-1-phosphate/altronate dehydrogenase